MPTSSEKAHDTITAATTKPTGSQQRQAQYEASVTSNDQPRTSLGQNGGDDSEVRD